MQETAVDNPYGLGALIANGDIIARSILAILLIMSLLTWFIMITKFFDQRRQRKQGAEAEREFWTSTSLTDALNKLKGTRIRSARWPKPASRLTSTTRPTSAGCRRHRHQRVDHRVAAAHRRHRHQPHATGLPVLASVGATAPFVGLLGTVIGIYHALIAIGVAGQASIDKVAGPVGEALIMTAIGLAVAVPAVLGYNILLRRNKGVQECVSHFTHELHAYLISGAKMGLGMDKGPAPWQARSARGPLG